MKRCDRLHNNDNQFQRVVLIIGYFTKGLSFLILSIFITQLFSEGGHFVEPHLGLHDIALLIFIPVVYSIGAFVSFKNKLTNSVIIFISFVGFNVSLFFIDHIGFSDIQGTFILAPSILFVALHLINKNEEVRFDEYNKLYGEYQDLNQNYKIIQGMMDITPEMLKDDNLDNLLQVILTKAIDVIPKAQTGSILIKNNNQMVYRAAVGYDLDLLKEVNLQFEDMYQYKLGNLYEPTVIKDIKTFNEAYLDPKKTKYLDEQGALIAKSVLTCAITVHNEIYGFINLDNIEDVDAFQDKDKIYIKHLSQQIEMALRNQVLVKDIYELSKYDMLTGAFTRQQYASALREVYEKAKKHKTVFSICMVDVNGLKLINDAYGHDIGDKYLIHFSKIMQGFIWESDFLSRIGGDEFIIVCLDCDKICAQNRIEELRIKIAKTPFVVDSISVTITFGGGVASFPEDSNYLDELITLSDQRMYIDKKNQK